MTDERAIKAAEMRAAGASYAAIATALNISKATAHADVQRALNGAGQPAEVTEDQTRMSQTKENLERIRARRAAAFTWSTAPALSNGLSDLLSVASGGREATHVDPKDLGQIRAVAFAARGLALVLLERAADRAALAGQAGEGRLAELASMAQDIEDVFGWATQPDWTHTQRAADQRRRDEQLESRYPRETAEEASARLDRWASGRHGQHGLGYDIPNPGSGPGLRTA